MGYFEAHNSKWALALDVTYMDLGQTVGPLDVDVSQTAVMAAAYRRVAPWAELMLGGQFNSIDASITGTGPVGFLSENTQSWFDPLVGLRLTAPEGGKWRVALQAHVGGFGIGSDFAWQLYPQFGYRFSQLFELVGAYRAINLDYKTGSGTSEFVYDVITFGPQLGIVLHF
jgi:hypothetical protein